MDFAVQANVEVSRRKQFGGLPNLDEAKRRVPVLIESGKVLSGLVRVAEKAFQGKAVRGKADVATINILGIVGMAIFMLLIALPIPAISIYRRGAVADVESSYRRAVKEIQGEECLLAVPDLEPSIIASVDDDNRQWFRHYYPEIQG